MTRREDRLRRGISARRHPLVLEGAVALRGRPSTAQFRIQRLCDLLRVSPRQRADRTLRAYARSAFAQSNAAHGSPRMHNATQKRPFVIYHTDTKEFGEFSLLNT